MNTRAWKIPESVLVLIHTPAQQVLLIRRADAAHPEDGEPQDYWQSVTGSREADDPSFFATAVREVREETGIDALAPAHRLTDWGLQNTYGIYPRWLHRYAPGVTLNTEHVFGLCVPEGTPVRLNPREHTDWLWLPRLEAADRCFSSSNAEAILLLPQFMP